jgi:hypothetical protein
LSKEKCSATPEALTAEGFQLIRLGEMIQKISALVGSLEEVGPRVFSFNAEHTQMVVLRREEFLSFKLDSMTTMIAAHAPNTWNLLHSNHFCKILRSL